MSGKAVKSHAKPPSRARATLYAHAVAALPGHAFALRQTELPQRTTVDRLALALEQCGGPERHVSRVAILREIGDSLRGEKDAPVVLRQLAKLDRRLAAWGACACAREALRFVPEGDERPLLAIGTAERWLAGQASVDEVRAARDGALDAWRTAANAYAYAAANAANAAYTAANAYAAYANAAAAYAAAAANAAYTAARLGTFEWTAAHNAELARLVGVVCDALPGLPPEVIA